MTESNEMPFLVLEEEGDPVLRVGLELEVFEHDDPHTSIDVLPHRWDVGALDEIRGPGSGAFTLWRNDPKLLASPNLLDWRNLVRVRLNHETVGAFLIQNKRSEIVSRDEKSGEVWSISGEGLRTWFRDAVVLPYRGLKPKSYGSRVFSFASERGAWYKEDDWTEPVKLQQHNLDPNTDPWGTAPAEWPDAPDAWWVWGVANDRENPALEGFNYFRYEFEIDDAVGDAQYAVFAAGDNHLRGFIDGQEILSAEENDSWTRTWRADFELSPGPHVLAFRVLNVGETPAALIAAFFRAGDASAETAAELLTVTGDPGWVVNAYPDPSPGWTPGEIVLTLLAEAEARGVVFPTFLTPTFTTEVDSYGLPWSRALDWSFSIGSEYFEVVERLEEAMCDLWIDPDSLELNMYGQRGIDRTTQSAAVSPIMFQVGRNVLRAAEDGSADIKNTLVLETADGWMLQADGESDSVGKYGAIEGSLTTGMSASVSGDVATAVFALKALPVLASTYELVDVDRARPFVDFNAGDWVLAPNSEDVLTPTRLLGIAVGENEKNGQPTYTVEFGTISEDQTDRHERWLKTLANGTLGGTVANASGSSGSGSSPNAQAVSKGPMGLQGIPGPVGVNVRGPWGAAIIYVPRDLVTYEGSSWLALAGSTGATPVEGATWTLLAAQGAPGEAGPQGLTYEGAWDVAVTYPPGSLVQHNDLMWISTEETLGDEPGTGPEWDEFTLPGYEPTAQTTVLTGITGTGTVDLDRGFTILSVAYSGAGRFRMYRTAAGRTADASRAFTTQYPGGRGLIYDYLAAGAETDLERPADGAWAPGETTCYYSADGPVDVTVVWVSTAGG